MVKRGVRREDCATVEERSKLRLEQQCAERILPLVKAWTAMRRSRHARKQATFRHFHVFSSSFNVF